ncbi:AMP-binding protein [Streptomyces anulatus]
MNGELRRTVRGLVERQALRTPDAMAVAQGHESLSYRELNCRADLFARSLLARKVRPGATVGLRMTRSVTLVVAMLGVLKAGAVFGVIPPPDAGEGGPCEAAGPRVVPDVTCGVEEVAASWEGEARLEGDPARAGGTARDVDAGTPVVPAPTGDGLVEVLVAEARAVAAGPGDAVLQRTPAHEPFAAFEIFFALVTGAGLYLMDDTDDENDAEAVVDALTLYHVTHVRLSQELLTAALSLSSMGAFRFLRAGFSLNTVWSTADVLGSALHARLGERFAFQLRTVWPNGEPADARAPGQVTAEPGAAAGPPDTPAREGAPGVRPPADPVTEGSHGTLALVTRLWSEILDRPGVAGEDDFFVLGGNSLTAVLASEELGEELGHDVPVSLLFEQRTAAAWARVVHARVLSGFTASTGSAAADREDDRR